MRRVTYLTGTRADFGLMRKTLTAIARHPELELSVLVTGMHLDPRFGDTWREVEQLGLKIDARIPVGLDDHPGQMAHAIAQVIDGCTAALEKDRPDLLLLLGDRGEMLAGAIAALHLNIPIAHIHGGERSGTVDEPVRHAISKMAHVHLVATEASAGRLRRMGESPASIHVVGAPGLDGLSCLASFSREDLCRDVGFIDAERPTALMVFHPVVQSAEKGAAETIAVLRALNELKIQTLALRPNSDFGTTEIDRVLQEYSDGSSLKVLPHLHRGKFVSWMANVDLMIGNSSSGVIEAASFGTPVVNVGTRQNMRERNHNVIDVAPESGAIRVAIESALRIGRYPVENLYGAGEASHRITKILSTIDLSDEILMKINEY